LGIGIDHQDFALSPRERPGKLHTDGGFAWTALLVHNCDDSCCHRGFTVQIV
jgi:hypothetical protein